jgi:hypothetical protein
MARTEKVWIKNLVDFAKPSILKPVSWAISYFVFLIMFLILLTLLLPSQSLYVSFRDSIVSLGKSVNIEIKKKNDLNLLIGHSDSEKGLQDDNYEVVTSNINQYEGIWFAISNLNYEDTYRNVRLFITFLDENKKIDGKDGGNGGWTKFKDNNFNNGTCKEIGPRLVIQTSSINFKYPKYDKYTFRYSIYADGYKPKSGIKTIIVKDK